MKREDKYYILKEFVSENKIHYFLIDLIEKMGFKDIRRTHRSGSPEFGKDIIAKRHDPIDGDIWYAFVVKKGKLLGNTNTIETIKNQISQAFEYPYESESGDSIRINRVVVVVNEHMSEGARESIGRSMQRYQFANLKFWWNETLVEYIDESYPLFWEPGDQFNKEYKKLLSTVIEYESQLTDLFSTKLPDVKVKKLLDLFVLPTLIEISYPDQYQTNRKIKPNTKGITISDIVNSNDSYLIKGDPGSGKSRLLDKIVNGILETKEMMEGKLLPIRLSIKTLRETDMDIEKTIKTEIVRIIKENDIDKYLKDKYIVLIIDNIDTLYDEELEKFKINMEKYLKNGISRFVMATRTLNNMQIGNYAKKVKEIILKNFNYEQIKIFLSSYFGDDDKTSRLLYELDKSNILEKLPTTPLTITLISLLYEDTNYEMPATITDLYNDFVNILVGKMEIKTRIQLLDMEIKKRIYSHIALYMINNNIYEINNEEVVNVVEEYIAPKGIELEGKEEINRIIRNSGLLYVNERNEVGFKHMSLLEYLVAYDIYSVGRNKVENMIENFNNVTWQNVAVFYAGFTKDAPWLIEEIIEKAPFENFRDWLLTIGGMGYIAQALYMTDVDIREKLVRRALKAILLSKEELMRLSKEHGILYKLPLAFIGTILTLWFRQNFRSVTLKNTLKYTYEKIKIENQCELNDSSKEEIALQLYIIAVTLASEYLDDTEKLMELIDYECFNQNPLLLIMYDIVDDMDEHKYPINDEKRKKLRKMRKRYKKVIEAITGEPAYRMIEDKKDIENEDGEEI